MYQSTCGLCSCFIAVPTVAFYVGSCCTLMAILQDISNDLCHLNEKDLNKFKSRFYDIVQLAANVKQLVQNHEICLSLMSFIFWRS